METSSGSLLGALAAGGGGVAGGPGSPLAEEGTNALVALLEFNIGSVAIQSASGCSGGGIDAAATSNLDSLVAAHGTITVF